MGQLVATFIARWLTGAIDPIGSFFSVAISFILFLPIGCILNKIRYSTYCTFATFQIIPFTLLCKNEFSFGTIISHFCLFSLTDIPEMCIICDSPPHPLTSENFQKNLPDDEGPFEIRALRPTLLRYVSSLKSSELHSWRFTIRYEQQDSASRSLRDREMSDPVDIWTFACGLYTVGRRIHFRCPCSLNDGKLRCFKKFAFIIV